MNSTNISHNQTSVNQTNLNQQSSSPTQQQSQSGAGGQGGKTPPSNSDLSSSFVKISVYYDDLRYTLIQDTPAITFDTLIGVIGDFEFAFFSYIYLKRLLFCVKKGGQFGLFMGASFLSFAEVAEMLVNLIRVTIKYKKQKKQIKAKIAW